MSARAARLVRGAARPRGESLMAAPLVSVIVPTHNRSESVRRLLHALSLQTPIEGGFEAIVVADGCTDSTARQISSASWPFELHVLEQASAGPAVARNCGAALARGEILLFLDDDVEPEPEVLRLHAALHASHARAVGLGYLPPIVPGGLFGTTLRGWWEGMFDGPRREWHRFNYRNLLSGHFSIARADFESLGGFDASFTCHEDWELGYRAIEADLQFTFIPAAITWHHENTDVTRALRRKFDEGVADVQLAQKHPALISQMPLGFRTMDTLRRSRIVWLAWEHPTAGERLASTAKRLLAIYERANLRFRWRALLDRLLGYSYWRGVAHALQSPEHLAALLTGAATHEPSEMTVDIAGGVDAAARTIDTQRPRSARVVHGFRIVGDIPAFPGTERLRAPHLRHAIARDFARPLTAILAERRTGLAVIASPVA